MDSVVTLAYLLNMSGKGQILANIARAIYNKCWKFNISITAQHIPGLKNKAADQLSRMQDYYNWQLNPQIFQRINKAWGPHTVDRFASHLNNLLPQFNSRWICPQSSGVDALAQSWKRIMNFVNAPFRMIPKVLSRVIRDKAEAKIIAPVWTHQPWFWTMLKLCVRVPKITNSKLELQQKKLWAEKQEMEKRYKIDDSVMELNVSGCHFTFQEHFLQVFRKHVGGNVLRKTPLY